MKSFPYLDVCKGLDNGKIIECIEKGLDRSLGNIETSNLVLKTLKVTYGLDKGNIPSSLDLFESLLEKMFGKSAACLILKNIASECTTR
jgi:hypothetical protein